jgi:hypothetical protein
MANPSCQELLNIYNSIVESGQIERFSAKEQIRILKAADSVIRLMLKYSDDYILDVVDAEDYARYTPYFADLISLSQSGPVSMEAVTENDMQEVVFLYNDLMRVSGSLAWFREYEREAIYRQMDDEREDVE